MKTLIAIVKSIRVKQWIKNVFVFMPLVFSGKLLNIPDVITAGLVFLVFCLASAGIYILNDIKDKNKDNFHPLKHTRPIASGELKTGPALVMSIIFICAALLASSKINSSFLIITFIYIAIHFLYSFRLKREVILDVVLIALGFELRVWAGGVVIEAYPSIWLQLCVFLLAIFLALIKRRHEKISLYRDAAKHRDVLSRYKVYFLDQIIMISACLCIVFYGFYSISPGIITKLGNTNMAYTIPFVVYGMFRYLYVVHAKRSGGDPSELLMSDLPLITNIILWMASVVFLVYK
jgi:4-hydroxybenzoate polyprenyltransferase